MSVLDRLTPFVEMKGIRRVKTPAGVRKYGQPIGSIIVRDLPLTNLVQLPSEYSGWGKYTSTPKARRNHNIRHDSNYYVGFTGQSWEVRDKRDQTFYWADDEEEALTVLNAVAGSAEPWKFPTSNTHKGWLMRAEAEWQLWTGSRRLRKRMKDYYRGKEQLDPQTEALRDAVNKAPRKQLPMYRGMVVKPGTFNAIVRRGVFDEPLGSATTDRHLAGQFAVGAYARHPGSTFAPRPDDVPVLIEMTNARALPFNMNVLLSIYAKPQGFGYLMEYPDRAVVRKKWQQIDEHLVAGHFVIDSVEEREVPEDLRRMKYDRRLDKMVPVEKTKPIQVLHVHYEGPLEAKQ